MSVKVETYLNGRLIEPPLPDKTTELKAEPMSSSQLDRWLSGKTPRRILVLPYGGPIPRKGAPLGVDIDDEWFDAETDTVDGHKALAATNKRYVDFHHDQDPALRGLTLVEVMKGAIVGHVDIDEDAETISIDGIDYTGRWGDFWANAGEKRRAMVAYLERRAVPLYGSSQAAYKKAVDGHILKWPLIRHTISTSPQNTYAVVPALKALLAAPNLVDVPADAVKALLVGLDAPTRELLLTSPELAADASSPVGDGVAKAGRVLSKQSITELQEIVDAVQKLIERGVIRLNPVSEETQLNE